MVGKDVDGAVSTYRYDLNDRLVGAEGPDASVTLLRDPEGRLAAETVNGRTSTFTYDAAGRQLSRTTLAGRTANGAMTPGATVPGLARRAVPSLAAGTQQDNCCPSAWMTPCC